jgi:hypothetical protein
MKTTTERVLQQEAQLNADEVRICSKYRGHAIVLVAMKEGGYTGYFMSPEDMDSFGRAGQAAFNDPKDAIADAKSRLDAELTILELDNWR